MAGITDPIAVRFEKMKERIMLALEPIGALILGLLERVTPYIVAFAERFSSAFSSLSPMMQMVAVGLAGLAAAAGPALVILGSLVTAIGALAASAGVIGIISAVIAGIGIALVPVLAIATIFYQAWAANWGLVKQVFNDGVAYISGIVNTGLAFLQGVWAEHGEAITAWAIAWWATLSNVFTAAMDIVASYVKLGLQVLHGDWTAVWQSILDITGQVWTAIAQLVSSAVAVTHKLLQAALPILVQAFVWLGTQILTVVTKAIGFVVDVFLNLPSYLLALVGKMFSAGMQIGTAIWEGVKSGLSGGLLGGGAGLNVGGAIGGPSSPFQGLLDSFKGLFGSGSLASMGGSVNTPTFITPLLNDTIKTTAAMSNLKNKIDAVKATASAPRSAVVAAKAASMVYGKAVTNAPGGILMDVSPFNSSVMGSKYKYGSQDATNEILAGLTKSVQEGRLAIEIIDPNRSTGLGATSANVNARYRQ
jgi:hypothetical protein